MPKRDFTQIAFSVVQHATGEIPKPKLNAKQEAGRKGGTIGGKKRMEALTPEQRGELGKRAREARRIKEALTSKEASAKAKNQLNNVS